MEMIVLQLLTNVLLIAVVYYLQVIALQLKANGKK